MPEGIGYGAVRKRKRMEKIDKPRAKPPLEKIHKGKKPKRNRSYK